MTVCGLVEVLEVQRRQPRPGGDWLGIPAQDGVHARIDRHGVVKGLPATRTHFADCRGTARPEKRCSRKPGFLGGHPQRLGLIPPARICSGRVIGNPKAPERRVFHRVVGDAVAPRAQAGDQRVVVGKRERRIRRRHPRGTHAFATELRNVRRPPVIEVAGREGVHRNQQHTTCIARRNLGHWWTLRGAIGPGFAAGPECHQASRQSNRCAQSAGCRG